MDYYSPMISATIEMHTEYEGISEEDPGLRKEPNQNQGTGKREGWDEHSRLREGHL